MQPINAGARNIARNIPDAGLLITKLSAGRRRARELFLKTIANAVRTGVVEFKAETSILDRILNAKQLRDRPGKPSGFIACLTVF